MAQSGRKKHVIPSVRWRVEVREDLAAKTELILYDPLRQEIAYGARSALVNQLLEEWLSKQLKQPLPEKQNESSETVQQ
jgi:hypothetical protein